MQTFLVIFLLYTNLSVLSYISLYCSETINGHAVCEGSLGFVNFNDLKNVRMNVKMSESISTWLLQKIVIYDKHSCISCEFFGNIVASEAVERIKTLGTLK